MAPGVAKSFVKNIFKILDIRYPECSDDELSDADKNGKLSNEDIKRVLKRYRKKHRTIMNADGYSFVRDKLKNEYYKQLTDADIDRIINKAKEITDDETHQAMEAVVHNLNSMHSRAGEHTRPNIAKAMVEAA